MSIKERYEKYRSGRAKYEQMKKEAYARAKQEEYGKELLRKHESIKRKAAIKARRNVAPVRYYAEKVGTGAKYTSKGLKEVAKGIGGGAQGVSRELTYSHKGQRRKRRPAPRVYVDPLGMYAPPKKKPRRSQQQVIVYAGGTAPRKKKKRKRQTYGLSYDWGI